MEHFTPPHAAAPSFQFHARQPPRSVAQSLARHLVDTLHASLPLDLAKQKLAAAGLSHELLESGEISFSYNDLSALYRQVATAIDDEMLGLWSRPMRLGVLRLLLQASVEAVNMRDILSRLASAYSLLLDDFSLVLVEGRKVLRLELRPRGAGRSPGSVPVVNPLAHVLTLRLVMGICDWLTGKRLAAGAVSTAFDHSSRFDDLEAFLGCRIDMGMPVTALVYPAHLGDVPLLVRHQQISDFVDRAPRIWLHDEPAGEVLEYRVREMLIGNLNLPLEEVARLLNLSQRTLIRRLRSDNLTFRAMRNELRQEWAIRELSFSGDSLDGISYALGFSSPSAFQRAFRQWTGMSPGMFRAKQRNSRGPGRGTCSPLE